MKRDSRLSDVLHVLLHMAEHAEPSTSEVLARAMRTNPVVIRRVLAGLRERGLVRSEKGHGGGWTLARQLSQITLRDVYEAIGSPSLIALGHRSERPECLLEKAVGSVLDGAFRAAEEQVLARFDDVTLASLQATFVQHRAARGRHRKEHHHAT